MKKIRLNTDFVIEWRSILINGAPANFNELSPLLFLVVDPLGQAHANNPTIIDDGHSLSVRIKAADLTVQGVYSLTVYIHHGETGQTAIDRCEAFALTPSLCCPPNTPSSLEHVVVMGGDVAVGVKGLSAYEIALKNGFKGSEEEWLQSLRQPATDAADNANQIMAEFQQKETAIIEAEQARIKAEQQRNTAEAQRIEDEASRTEAEQARTEAENLRNTAEAQRIKNEASRTEAETQRVTAEQQRAETENSRSEAEQQRTEAENLRNTAEAQRIKAEASRTEAEVQRATAEQQRSEAEQARVTAEANRQQQTTAAIEAAKTATASATSATAEAAKAVTAATNATTEAKEAAKLATDAASKTSTVDYAVCTTAATTATKEINIAGFALGTHCRFLVKMSHIAETEDVKLSVRSGDTLTEPKPLTFNGAPASVNNTWRADDILDIYYDGSSFHATHYMGGYGITEINVSEMCPKGGHNGTNKFTLAEAIKKIPEAHQRIGFKCSFINDNGEIETAVYQGGKWNKITSWYKINDSADRYVSTLGLSSFGFYLSQAEVDIINASDSISVLAMVAPGNKARKDWPRYIALFNTRNSKGVVAIDCAYNGKYIIFNNSTDLVLNSYKQLVSVNRVSGKVMFADELGLREEILKEEFKQPDFMANNAVIVYGGDNLGRYADYALFNFDFAYILAFNNEIIEYMQGNNISGRLPQNLIQPNQDVTPVVYEKYQADTYGMYWDKPQQDEEGYYVYKTNTTKKAMQIKVSTEHNPKINEKAGCEEIVFEVLEGSVSHGEAEQALPVGKVRSIVNISTGEQKKVGDELSPGVYKSTSDYWRRGAYRPDITAQQVPAKVRLISYSFKPYIAIAHLDCSRCYEGEHKVYDEIIGSTRQTTTNTKITPYSIHLNASTYKTKAPDRKPRFVGERWYNTETGDIYEAGNLSVFKKTTP